MVIASEHVAAAGKTLETAEAEKAKAMKHVPFEELGILEQQEQQKEAELRSWLRRWDDANLWSGFHVVSGIPRAVVTLRLRYWSLPVSLSIGGHVLQRAGFTLGLGPLYLSWSWV